MLEFNFVTVSKNYKAGLFKKSVSAVRDLSFEVRKGEVFGMVGPNGAGKSSTIRLLLGLLRPDVGKIYFRGRQLQIREVQRAVGYLPESPYLYDHLTLVELLRFCGRVSGLSPVDVRQRSEQLMERLAMTEARKRPMRTYSKGMLQRAGICFALLQDPELVVLDEPMSGLDPLGRKMVFDLICELKKEGKTIFLCSHILNDVERLCDRIGFMVNGSMVKTLENTNTFVEKESLLRFVVPVLSAAQEACLRPLLQELATEEKGQIISFWASEFHAVSQALRDMDVKVMSGRSTGLALEDIFLQEVMARQ